MLPGLNGHLVVADFPTGLFFALNVDTGTLNGGQSELRQVRLRSPAGQTLPFISFINAARAVRGLGTSSRADLRFGVNTPGRVFLINKHDGIVRELTLDPTLDSDRDSCPDILDDDPTSALQVVGHYLGAQCPLGGGSVHASPEPIPTVMGSLAAVMSTTVLAMVHLQWPQVTPALPIAPGVKPARIPAPPRWATMRWRAPPYAPARPTHGGKPAPWTIAQRSSCACSQGPIRHASIRFPSSTRLCFYPPRRERLRAISSTF